MRKRTKHENTQSPSFAYDTKMAADVNTGVQSINTERAENTVRGLVYKHVCACIHPGSRILFLVVCVYQPLLLSSTKTCNNSQNYNTILHSI